MAVSPEEQDCRLNVWNGLSTYSEIWQSPLSSPFNLSLISVASFTLAYHTIELLPLCTLLDSHKLLAFVREFHFLKL